MQGRKKMSPTDLTHDRYLVQRLISLDLQGVLCCFKGIAARENLRVWKDLGDLQDFAFVEAEETTK